MAKITFLLEVTVSTNTVKSPGESLDYQMKQLVDHITRDGGEILKVQPLSAKVDWDYSA